MKNATHISKTILEQWARMELSEDENLRIEAHLEECTSCIESIPFDQIIRDNEVMRFICATWRENARARDTRFDSTFSRDTSAPNPPTSKSTEPNLTTDRYARLELQGAGGIGQVWRCRDLTFDRVVALKQLHEKHLDSRQAKERLLREAIITGQLEHPGIAPVYGLNDDPDNLFYTMRLIEGKSLAEAIKIYHYARRDDSNGHNGSLACFLKLLRHFVTVCETIAYAHSKSIIHRDIKSDNVVVGDFGEVVLLDWGLAKHMSRDHSDAEEAVDVNSTTPFDVRQTVMGQRLGTPAFMSPEQARGDTMNVSYASDIWGLSAMLYEILSGVPPFFGATAESTIRQVLNDPVEPCRVHNSDVPVELEEVCLKGLQKSPDERIESAKQLGGIVDNWLSTQVERTRRHLDRQNFFNLSTEMMAIVDTRKGILEANPAWHKTLGWNLDDLIGKTLLDLIHPDYQRLAAKRLYLAGKGQGDVNVELPFQCRNGKYIWTSWSASPFQGHRQVYVIGRDINERKKAELLIPSLFDAAPDAMIVTDSRNVIRTLNQRAKRMFGFIRKELIGQHIHMLFPVHCRKKYAQFVLDYNKQPQSLTMDQTLESFGRQKDGQEIPIQIRISTVNLGENEILISTAIRLRKEQS